MKRTKEATSMAKNEAVMGGDQIEKSYVRLQEEHDKALNSSRERIKKWERFRDDYQALQSRLYSLPNQLKHDVMVPFGRFAFMPGHLYHTNEIMVLLGENWFAKRTVKQAIEVAERRKQYVIKMLEDEKKQLEDWDARITFTKEMKAAQQEHDNIVEIKEAYSSSVSPGKRVWTARKPKHSGVPPPRPAFPKSSASSSSQSLTINQSERRRGESEAALTDQQLREKLDALEREEEREEEEKKEKEDFLAGNEEAEEVVMRCKEEEFLTEREGGEAGQRKEKRGNQVEKKTEMGSGGGDIVSPLKITIKHSIVIDADQEEGTDDNDDDDDDDGSDGGNGPLFKTPADIFKHSQCPRNKTETVGEYVITDMEERAKGVRWNPQLTSYQEPLETVGEDCVESSNRSESRKSNFTSVLMDRPPLAFSGQVVEHSPSFTTTEPEEPRKMSRFKKSRKLA